MIQLEATEAQKEFLVWINSQLGTVLAENDIPKYEDHYYLNVGGSHVFFGFQLLPIERPRKLMTIQVFWIKFSFDDEGEPVFSGRLNTEDIWDDLPECIKEFLLFYPELT